ncbi:LysE family translocator [Candidatus Halobonum tyrrellensis]|uniref:LysE family L-lysine efflux protein n=1 Tax=Candidatus Halobonum tyrrellensis G22 TaxID=1324957 RepID=V4HHV0_9EURY|nr:LysE family transporter [Candidatus Halobonum tyrrellensis]ESP89318.1 LysE family L-lysine efflux protein [Candidatus Halobonum tyrrellensis G22]
MTTLAVTAAAGVAFGLALAAPPGPMNAVIAEESAVRGRAAGVRAGLGAATADFTFFVLALAGVVEFVDRYPAVRGAMVAAGGLLMLYFAYGTARDLRGSFLDAGAAAGTEEGADDGEPASSAGFRKALVLALTNPFQALFWLTVGVGLLRPGRIDVFAAAGVDRLAGALVVETGSPALLAGFFAGVVLWVTGFPTAIAAARDRVEALAPAVAAVSAVVLGGFGVAFLVDAAGTFGLLAALAALGGVA